MTELSSTINNLPSRIANKLRLLDSRTLRAIRGNRLRRTNGDYARHTRRHHIFLACTDLAIAAVNAKRAAFRATL